MKNQLKVNTVRYGTKYLSILEFETLLNNVAEKVNERGLDLKPGVGEYLCPNQMIYGRSGLDGIEDHVADIPLLKRPFLIQRHLNAYLDKWSAIRQVQLMTSHKWLEEEKNLEVGEYVLILDKPLMNSFTIGRVEECFPDEDDLIRKVRVSYSLKGTLKETLRHVVDLARLKVQDELVEGLEQVQGPVVQEVQDEMHT